MALDALPNRRCSTCTHSDQINYGCYSDTKRPLKLDGETLYRCPLRPIKDDTSFFNEIFSMYAFFDKGVLAEGGSYYDQPNLYVESMMELQSTISDRNSVTESFNKERMAVEDNKLDKLRELGLNIVKRQV